jgi:hypothetical protein
MAIQFAFVAADAHGKARKSDNLLIRSHCMRGKNKRESSRRSRRQAQQQTSVVSNILEESIGDSLSGGHEPREEEPLVLLRGPMSGLEYVQFATDVDDYSKQIFFKCMCSDQSAREVQLHLISILHADRYVDESYSSQVHALYPLEHHLAYDRPNYAQYLASDVAFVHAMLLTVSAINDVAATNVRPSALTRVHLRNTLHYLSERLSEAHSYTIDSTITVILTLGHVAALFGDSDAATVHLKGLARIVELRGGAGWLARVPKFHAKFDR